MHERQYWRQAVPAEHEAGSEAVVRPEGMDGDGATDVERLEGAEHQLLVHCVHWDLHQYQCSGCHVSNKE